MNQKEALYISGKIFGQIWTEKFGVNEMNAERCFRTVRWCSVLFLVNCVAAVMMLKVNVEIETAIMLTVPFVFISSIFIVLNLDILLSSLWLHLAQDWAKVRWRMKKFYSSNPQFSKNRALFGMIVTQEICLAIDAEGIFQKRGK